jgi:hypothetical protein
MFYPGENLALGRAVALQLIRDEHPWHIGEAFEQLAKALLRDLLVAPTLHQDSEDVVVLIHGPPERVPYAMDGEKDLIQGPFVPGPRPSAPETIRVILPELETPLANGFRGHVDAACKQQLLPVAVALGEPIVKPDPMADDFSGKAVVLVALGVGRRGRVWLPILVLNWS